MSKIKTCRRLRTSAHTYFSLLWLAAVVLLLGTASAVSAQEITGNIAGTVTDATGALIPNATVTITNTDTKQLLRTLKTGPNGDYAATLLPIGHYSVVAESAGFKRVNKTGIELNVNDRLTINFTMEVGDVAQEIQVQETGVQVETQTAAQSTLIDGTQVRELALNNRNFVQLVTLAPGVVSGTIDQPYIGVSNPTGTTNTLAYSINGLRSSQNNWTVDGADNVDRGSNITLLNFPSVDALSEFKIQRSTYSSEFGRSAGGQINIITNRAQASSTATRTNFSGTINSPRTTS